LYGSPKRPVISFSLLYASSNTGESGQANLLIYIDVEGYSCFERERPFRILESRLEPNKSNVFF
jgi:hypothetical protein